MLAGYREGWTNLAFAVVLQAVEDYRAALKKMKRFPRRKKYQREVKACEDFFLKGNYPKFYEAVLEVDGRLIVERIRKEVRHGNQKRKTAES